VIVMALIAQGGAAVGVARTALGLVKAEYVSRDSLAVWNGAHWLVGLMVAVVLARRNLLGNVGNLYCFCHAARRPVNTATVALITLMSYTSKSSVHRLLCMGTL
jgi:hypothetical protein